MALPIYNVDGTPNESGNIKEAVDLMISYNGHHERATFHVTNLGSVDCILGLPCGHNIKAAKKEWTRRKEPYPASVLDWSGDESLDDHDSWYYPGTEVNWNWFDDDKIEDLPDFFFFKINPSVTLSYGRVYIVV